MESGRGESRRVAAPSVGKLDRSAERNLHTDPAEVVAVLMLTPVRPSIVPDHLALLRREGCLAHSSSGTRGDRARTRSCVSSVAVVLRVAFAPMATIGR
jgi:hypothetical protein